MDRVSDSHRSDRWYRGSTVCLTFAADWRDETVLVAATYSRCLVSLRRSVDRFRSRDSMWFWTATTRRIAPR